MAGIEARASGKATIFILTAAIVLSGCGAGQQSQTASMAADVNGASADIGHVALRNIRMRGEQTSYALQPGKTVDLVLVATNQSPVTEDTLVAVTADVGVVTVVGSAALPLGGVLIVDIPHRAMYARALAEVKPVNIATATVTLTKPISSGLLYKFTFRFAHAGETSADVSVSTD